MIPVGSEIRSDIHISRSEAQTGHIGCGDSVNDAYDGAVAQYLAWGTSDETG